MTLLKCETRQLDLSLAQRIPVGLREVLELASQARYPELYEEQPNAQCSLEEALTTIVQSLGQASSCAEFSYWCLAVILNLAVRPTVQCYLPDEAFTPYFFEALLQGWIRQSSIPQDLRRQYASALGQYQALDEAILVLEGSLEVLAVSPAPAILVEMLDLCLEGYAIFPGSADRRALLDWCLWEAIPAACLGLFPKNIYTIQGLGNSQDSLALLANGQGTVADDLSASERGLPVAKFLGFNARMQQ